MQAECGEAVDHHTRGGVGGAADKEDVLAQDRSRRQPGHILQGVWVLFSTSLAVLRVRVLLEEDHPPPVAVVSA